MGQVELIEDATVLCHFGANVDILPTLLPAIGHAAMEARNPERNGSIE